MSQLTAVQTIADLAACIEAGGLGYSPANQRKVLGSLRKCAAVYSLPLERIAADPAVFDGRWGRGPVHDFPVAHFRHAEAYKDWRSNVRGALARASGATAQHDERKHRDDDWSALLAATTERRSRELGLDIALTRIADYGRQLGLGPTELTTAAMHALRLEDPTRRGKAMLGRSVGRFDRLRADPALTAWMPPLPVGPLPPLRRPRGDIWQSLPTAVQNEWDQAVTSLAAGKPSPISYQPGRPLSSGYLGQIEAAMAWYLEHLVDADLIDPTQVGGLDALLDEQWVRDCARAALANITAAAPDQPLTPSSIESYLKRLKRVFQHFGRDIDGFAALARDPALRRSGGLTRENEAFCRLILDDSKRRTILLTAPERLRARAEAALRGSSRADIAAAIRSGTIATAMAILTRVAPLRAENTLGLRFQGDAPTLFLRAGAGSILIPGPEVKNRKLFRAPFPENAGKRCPRRVVDWYLTAIRPLAVARTGFADSGYLLPGRNGPLCYPSYLQWFRLEMAAIGLPMTPHQCRHAVATLLLDRHPDAVALVAALLGDDERTVLKHYAFIDRERRVERAQTTLLATAQAHLRRPR